MTGPWAPGNGTDRTVKAGAGVGPTAALAGELGVTAGAVWAAGAAGAVLGGALTAHACAVPESRRSRRSRMTRTLACWGMDHKR